ncbi:MAG TPA: TonB-dependent receptor [Terriglobales bacterium]|nr:TonB-dependent receptor [Terriglobales bacterium]
MLKFWLRAVALFAFVIVFTFSLPAQVQNGQFNGTVLDPSGAAVPNAKITIKNSATGFSVTATSNQSGFYTAKELPVGTYSITAQAQGFKTVSQTGVSLNAGAIQRVDLHLEVGQVSQTVEVSGAAPAVNTEDSRLSTNVGANQISNLPLNGRNVYDLIQQAPGAVNVNGVDFENGHGTVVNGLREDFNGFMINGVSNKGLSGGVDTTPVADTVQEFQLLTLNMSAQYGNSAGAITNLVTKSGTNSFHGDVWEFIRNDALDSMDFYTAHTPDPADRKKAPLRFNQFGGTFGGPLIKDKLFFFGSYQGDRFVTSHTGQVQTESPQFRQAVESVAPNSVAALLYKNFAPTTPITSTIATVDDFVKANLSKFGFKTYADYLCPDSTSPAIAARFASILGVTAADQAAMAQNVPYLDTTKSPVVPCSTIPGIQPGAISRDAPMLVNVTKNSLARGISGTESGNLFNGNEASLRLDFTPSQKDRIFGQFNWFKSNDEFFSGISAPRPFSNPETFTAPNFQFSFVHTFSASVLNEFRAGYVGSLQTIGVSTPGVPEVGFDDGSLNFGSYSGYPQTFHENVYTYSDMVSVQHGNHALKIGADIRRNLENSNFNVGRPSYFMSDEMFFAADAPYGMAAGVDPGFADGTVPHLDTNKRHWRNWEVGLYFQDDWKATRRLTLNLGLRYDLYTRHTEENGLVTTFIPGPGNNIIAQIANANVPFTTTQQGGQYITSCNPSTVAVQSSQILAGVCGPGGFSKASSLGKGDHNDFGPRIGFAYDMFGNGKTSLRGGFGVSYEGTLYNPLSNSRWNPPYYSFNEAFNALGGGSDIVPYGPQTPGSAPRYTGGPDPLNNQGFDPATSTGNIQGWAPTNPDQAILTGIVFPGGIRDPYVYNWYLGVQHEIAPKTVVEVDYVATAGHKLFRAQNVNRMAGDRLPSGVCTTDIFGRNLCSNINDLTQSGHAYLNPNYGNLRAWENIVNSNYNALQAAIRHQMAHGVQFNLQYTWSHSLDDGSTWHSGATTANGAAAGEGYSTDQTLPQLDYGNSIYDIRQRLSANYVIQLPWQDKTGFVGKVLGGWQLNGLLAIQTGAHWSPFCGGFYKTCDFNKDGVANDRPNAVLNHFTPSHSQWADGWGDAWVFGNPGSNFTDPNPVCTDTFCTANPGNLGRNTFVGPAYWTADLSLVKNLHITERVNFQFRAESFNLFNHTNFQLPGNNGDNQIQKDSFGCACSTFDPRTLQFGAKIMF